MRFLIQAIDGKIKHDFSFALLQAIDFHKWTGNDIKFRLSDGYMPSNYIPVGSVEFVSEYINKFYGVIPKPINIPAELISQDFCGRNVINGTNLDIDGLRFVKSNDKIKSFTEICDSAPVGNYQISDLINIQSEYRCFVYKQKLVGINNYSGDFTIFPDIDKINKMIESFKSAPVAYTLDVAICDGDTVVIEVHDFFSCGLYGFSDLKILPYMFSQWYYEYIRKINR